MEIKNDSDTIKVGGIKTSSNQNAKSEFSNLQKRFYEVRNTIEYIDSIRNKYQGAVTLPPKAHSKVLDTIKKLY